MLAARALGRNESVPQSPDLHIALMVEQFGPIALGAAPNFFELARSSHLLSVRDMYQVAGTKQQGRLNESQWELIVELDRLAASLSADDDE